MSSQQNISRIVVIVLWMVLPTTILMNEIIIQLQQYYSFIQTSHIVHSLLLTSGMITATVLFQYRWRFLPITLLQFVSCQIVYHTISRFSTQEFDGFYLQTQIITSATVWFTGWIIGWMFQRLKPLHLMLALTLIMSLVICLSTLQDVAVSYIKRSIGLSLMYVLYIMFVSQMIHHQLWNFRQSWKKILGATFIFIIFWGGIIVLLMQIYSPILEEKILALQGNGKESANSMLQTEKDGSISSHQQMQLMGHHQKGKNPEPLFCAHIDHYFDGTNYPNPLYLTAFHYDKFDETTETFERDSLQQFHDEFVPSVADLPLFTSFVDSMIYTSADNYLLHQTIDIEIYKKRLSKQSFIAPSTAYWVQPISIEKEFQQTFSSAYRAKSVVSNLNSAYFIYNIQSPEIEAFQQKRFNILRKAKDYTNVPTNFIAYYTQFPKNPDYQIIQTIADSISRNKKSTIDKVLAVRDYFLQRNAAGEQVYAYSDNPGIPGIPGASKLLYFLTTSKKGYCAYYAASSVFLLRAMHIPCRVVTGFLTVDRSDKNKGWYWYYEDQAHAWVQVFFPGYGWIDFDFTVGNDDAQESPKPDGTPPLQPPKPSIVVYGQISTIDTNSKKIAIQSTRIILSDKQYVFPQQRIVLDAQQAICKKDSNIISIKDLHAQEMITAVAYDNNELYRLHIANNHVQLTGKPDIAVDEIYVSQKQTHQSITPKQVIKDQLIWNSKWFLISIVCVIFFLIISSLPYLQYVYWKQKSMLSKNGNKQMYYAYRAISLSLFQLQMHNETYLTMHAAQLLDQKYQSVLTNFIIRYQSTKYSRDKIDVDKKYIQSIFQSLQLLIRANRTLFQQCTQWIDVYRWLRIK